MFCASFRLVPFLFPTRKSCCLRSIRASRSPIFSLYARVPSRIRSRFFSMESLGKYELLHICKLVLASLKPNARFAVAWFPSSLQMPCGYPQGTTNKHLKKTALKCNHSSACKQSATSLIQTILSVPEFRRIGSCQRQSLADYTAGGELHPALKYL